MIDAETAEVLGSIIEALTESANGTRHLIEAAHALSRRTDALEESYGDVLLELGELTRRARLLVNMKAATLVQTCADCGAEYAKEAGPELCGKCWIKRGRPGGPLTVVS